MKIVGHTLVWGEQFVTRFLEYCLPTWMASGNLPYLAYRYNYEHHICTRREDWECIIRSRSYGYMIKFFKVSPIFIDGWNLEFNSIYQKYDILSRITTWSLGQLDDFYGLMCSSPDIIWSENLCVSIVKQLNLGKRIYFNKPIRVLEDVVKRVRGKEYCDTISLTSRYLVKISINNLHPDWSNFEIDSDNSALDEKCIWRVKDKGLIVRSAFSSPTIICPNSPEHFKMSLKCDKSPLDCKLCYVACPDRDTYYFQEDSDEGMMIEPCSHTSNHEPKLDKIVQYCSALKSFIRNEDAHFELSRMSLKFKFHFQDLDESWLPVEYESDRFIEKVLWVLENE